MALVCHFALELDLLTTNKSFGVDVSDELLPELVDTPGTTRGTKLSVLHTMFLPFFGLPWLLTADPLIGEFVVFAKLAKR